MSRLRSSCFYLRYCHITIVTTSFIIIIIIITVTTISLFIFCNQVIRHYIIILTSIPALDVHLYISFGTVQLTFHLNPLESFEHLTRHLHRVLNIKFHPFIVILTLNLSSGGSYNAEK